MAFSFNNATLDAYASDLVLAWRLEDANITDDSGEGNDGSNNGTDNGTGKNNNCRDWVAANQDYISDTDFADITGSLYTIAFWMYDESGGVGFRRWFTTTNAGVGATDILFRETDSSGVVQLYAAGSSGASSGTTWKGSWVHWVLRADGTDIEAILNGDTASPEISFTDSGTPATGFYFGGYYNVGPAEFYEGRMDELYIWDTNLSDAAIAALYNSGSGRFYEDQAVSLPTGSLATLGVGY